MNNKTESSDQALVEHTFSFDLEVDETQHTAHAEIESIGSQSSFDRLLLSIESKLTRVLEVISFVAMTVLAVSMFAQVILRYVFNNPFLGIEETSILLGVWVYFVGMSLSIRKRESIHGGILTLVTKKGIVIRSVRLIGSLICLGAVFAFGWMAIEYVLFAIKAGKLSLYLGWPKSLWSLSMAVGFSAAFVYFILQAYAEILDLKNNKTKA